MTTDRSLEFGLGSFQDAVELGLVKQKRERRRDVRLVPIPI